MGRTIVISKMNNDYVNNDYDGDYKSKEEFYDSVERHSEIVFEWKDNRTKYVLWTENAGGFSM